MSKPSQLSLKHSRFLLWLLLALGSTVGALAWINGIKAGANARSLQTSFCRQLPLSLRQALANPQREADFSPPEGAANLPWSDSGISKVVGDAQRLLPRPYNPENWAVEIYIEFDEGLWWKNTAYNDGDLVSTPAFIEDNRKQSCAVTRGADNHFEGVRKVTTGAGQEVWLYFRIAAP